MKIAIIGTGVVGRTLAAALNELNNEVWMGTRNVSDKLSETARDMYGNPPLNEWMKSNSGVKLVPFSEAAFSGELIINATNGSNSINALNQCGTENLSGKIILDIANPLDFSHGMPPSLIAGLNNTNSLAEEIQKSFPGAMVVKTLNTMTAPLMVKPGQIGNGEHVNFICGNSDKAKVKAITLLGQLGWKQENILDLGDISGARVTEAYVALWVRMMGSLKTNMFNIKIVK